MSIVINGSGTVTGLAVGGLPDGTVDAGTLASNAVTEAKIASNAVVTAKLNDDAVTNAKVAANAIAEAQLAANAVVTGKIEDSTITAGDLASGVGALSSQYVSFTRNAASGAGTQAVSGVGFQPTAVLFLASIGGAGMASVGFEDSGREGDSLADRHLISADNFDVEVWNGDPINMVYASTVNYGANISSYDSDGFTLTWATRGSPSGTVKLRALCLK